MMKVLMIEDNESVCEMMSMFFEKEQFEGTFIHDGKEGYETYAKSPTKWDLIILDLNLPSMDGIQVCRKIRAISNQTPIIMLTAQDSESDQVIGLEMGADDYVTKPFSPLTLLARMKALHRRATILPVVQGSDVMQEAYDVVTKTIKINTTTRETLYLNQPLDNLTPKEYELLLMFSKSPKRVFSREQLLKNIWEDPFYGDERTVDAHIKKLRHKIEHLGPQIIHTVWGVGYKFDDSGDA